MNFQEWFHIRKTPYGSIWKNTYQCRTCMRNFRKIGSCHLGTVICEKAFGQDIFSHRHRFVKDEKATFNPHGKNIYVRYMSECEKYIFVKSCIMTIYFTFFSL